MTEERELERHNRVLGQITSAKTREDLPKIGFSTIASYLANNIYFNNEKISQKLFQPVIKAIIDYGAVVHPEVKNALIRVIIENYSNISEDEIIEKYKKVLESKRIVYLLSEIAQKNIKLDEIVKSENFVAHKQILKYINSAFEIKDLPKVGLSELNKKLLRAVNDNDFVNSIKTSDIKELTEAFLKQYTYMDIEDVVERIISKYDLSESDKKLMKEQILGSLIQDETIEYTVEEIVLKEKRKIQIYKINHEEIMDMIKNAHRISQLPPNLTISTVNSYLNGNTTIYTNDDRITAEDLKKLTDLLMDGYKWEDEVVISEVKKIALSKYPDKNDAFSLLYNKLSVLPKTYYLIEEVKYSQERQTEFIGRGSSNVNVYFIPNNKSPLDGGRFYNCYINRVGNLDLSQILPLDLDSIVPTEMDIDSVEWYVQEHFDPTFKTAGGIILNKDETIGNVSVFRPNDGTVGISPEEKEKMDDASGISALFGNENQDAGKLHHQAATHAQQVQRFAVFLHKEIEVKEKKSQNVGNRMQQILTSYEQKALSLQMELLSNISNLKNEIGIDSVQTEEENRLRKGLKK